MLLIKPLLAFRPNKLDWIFATKTFLAGMLALYVAFYLNLAYPIWAIGTVFVIANPYSGMMASKSVYRVLGTILGAIVAVAVTPWLINTPWLFTLFLAAWVGTCLYFSLLDRTPRSYVLMLAGYTSVIIAFNEVYFIDTSSLFDMAVGRVLEISLGVVCSAIVTSTIFPMHIGPTIQNRVQKTLTDTEQIFHQLLVKPHQEQNYTQTLSHLARDIADIHVMAEHLSYEKSALQGMTKPLQDMLSQLTMVVSNLVAMSERMQQLDAIDIGYREGCAAIQVKVEQHLKAQENSLQDLESLLTEISQDFVHLLEQVPLAQQFLLEALHRDMRHFLLNIQAIQIIWQGIQAGNRRMPETKQSSERFESHLHRDHAVALRGGIAAFITVIVSTAFWILSGWKAGFMLAEMAAISACILTTMDNPVPALKMFIRGNIYAGVIIFIYAYGIFPHVTAFWQLVVVLAPFCMFCLMLYLHPPLIGIGLPMIMGTTMGLSFQNRYSLDQVFFFDATIGTIMGPVVAVLIVHMVRAMSPDLTVQHLLSQHYQSIRQAIYMRYDSVFRRHLRVMFDRIGILNTKMVQAEHLKQCTNQALVELSAVVELARLQEYVVALAAEHPLKPALLALQQHLEQYFCCKQKQQSTEVAEQVLQQYIQAIFAEYKAFTVSERDRAFIMSLMSIQHSFCHLPSHLQDQSEVVYG